MQMWAAHNSGFGGSGSDALDGPFNMAVLTEASSSEVEDASGVELGADVVDAAAVRGAAQWAPQQGAEVEGSAVVGGGQQECGICHD